MESDWINRYIYAVGKEFSEPQRTEIEKEIRGLIADMLDARTGDRIATEADVKAVLTELGNPRLLADKYRDRKRYLIGPALYPTYINILKLVGFAISIAMLVLLVVQCLADPNNILKAMGNTLITLVSACLQGFTWVTLGFAIAERYQTGKVKIDLDEEHEWKLSDLPELPEKLRRIPRYEPIWSIGFGLVFGILMTVAIRFFGIWFMEGSRTLIVVPFFAEAVFRSYLPYIWALILFDIAVEFTKYHEGTWTVKLTLLEILGHVLHFVLALFMFSNQAIWNPDFMQQLSQAGMFAASSGGTNAFQMVWSWVTDSMVLMFGLVFGLILLLDAIKVFRMVRRIE